MQLKEITEGEIAAVAVSSLPTRPTAAREFGGLGYTPAQLKAAFDRLPRLIAEKYNLLVRELTNGEIWNEIQVAERGKSVATLIADLEAADLALQSECEETAGRFYEQTLRYDRSGDTVSLAIGAGATPNTSVTLPLAELRRDIQLLRSMLLSTVITDTEVEDAYSIRTTAGGLPIVDAAPTRVSRIMGDTVKSINCFDLSGAAGNKFGISISAENNTLSFSGIPTAAYATLFAVDDTLFQDGATYTFSQSRYFGKTGTAHTVQNAVYWQINQTDKSSGVSSVCSTASDSITLTVDKSAYTYCVSVRNGNFAYSAAEPLAVTVSFMCNRGDSVCPYTKYYDGLHHASFWKVESYNPGQSQCSSLTATAPVSIGKWDRIEPGAQKKVIGTRILTFDGSEAWTNHAEGIPVHELFAGLTAPLGSNGTAEVVCSHYESADVDTGETGISAVCDSGRNIILKIYDPAFGDMEGWKAHLAALMAAGKPLTVAVHVDETRRESIATVDGTDSYTAYRDGFERVLQTNLTVSEATDGTVCTVRQNYYVTHGGKE